MNCISKLINNTTVLLACWFAQSNAFGCGPFFPNCLLDRGDAAIMTAPEARFRDELERMKLVVSRHRAIPGTNYPQQTLEIELTDLRLALMRLGRTGKESEAIIQRHRAEREKISVFAREESTTNSMTDHSLFVLRPDATNASRIKGVLPQVTPGLPGEFGDYLRGSIAWHQGDLKAARKHWIALLARPKAERQFKSTWAAFMLGKSWEEEDRKKARHYFHLARTLASDGFADSLGLAAASLGWEARCYLHDENYSEAIDLYLEQAATGDSSAITSLRWTAAAAIAAPPSILKKLASHPRAQRAITAYVISGGFRDAPIDVDSSVREAALHALDKASTNISLVPASKPAWHRHEWPVLRWLRAVESANVKDVDAAEQIALAAYQSGQMEMAERWLARASETPVAQWLKAKLALRAGRPHVAAALLAKLCRDFPVDQPEKKRAKADLAQSLFVSVGQADRTSAITMGQEVRGELGVLRLARRQYSESLELLLQSGYWIDAAYVAERVLTLDELKTYVDRSWPNESKRAVASSAEALASGYEQEYWSDRVPQRFTIGERIRYLLARRMARANRPVEARAYYPSRWRSAFDRLRTALGNAEKSQSSQIERACAYFEAAQITRTNGIDLIGTEVEPDWRIYGGNFDYGITLAGRISLQNSNVVAATSQELARATQNAPDPDKRYHYRYTAAKLAWEAAKLMPNNDDETARVLCIGGSWLKNRDPAAADVFYKALVRRCRKTAIGAEADRVRWFPKLDENGNVDRKNRN